MTRQDWIVVSLSVILILLMVYFAWIYLQTQVNLFLGIVLLWAILPPIFSNLPYSLKYALILPAPIFGAWYLFIVTFGKLGLLSIYAIILAPFLSLFVVYTFHFLTRRRVMFWKIPLASLTRTGIAAISAMFIPIGVMLIDPDGLKLDMQNRLLYFVIVLFAYVASSMLFVNSSYRYNVLSDRLKTYNMEKHLEKTWAKIKRRFPEKEKDCELLQYYSSESFRAFLEGDYEKSLIWGYKVIREPTVVDPMLYVNDQRVGKPSFSDIRNTLEHSRRKGHVDATEIRQTMKGLFDASLDLVEREIILLNKITEERLKRYLKDFSSVLKETDRFDDFLRSFFEECIMFLKGKLNASFPTIVLKKCYNSKDFEKAWLDAGQSGQQPTAFILHSRSPLIPAYIVLDLQRLMPQNEETFIVNLTLNIMEEMLHSLYPLKSEQEVHDLLYPLAEEFLGIELPEAYEKFKVKDDKANTVFY